MVKNPDDIDSVQKDIEADHKGIPNHVGKRKETGRSQTARQIRVFRRPRFAGRVAEALVRYIAMTGGIEAVDQLYAEYDRVTPEDIHRAAQEYYQPQRCTVAVLKGEK